MVLPFRTLWGLAYTPDAAGYEWETCEVLRLKSLIADPGGPAVWSMGLRPLACWDCGFECRWGHGCLSVVNVVCCQIEVSPTGWSFIQRSPTECGMCLNECNFEVTIMRRPWSIRGCRVMERRSAVIYKETKYVRLLRKDASDTVQAVSDDSSVHQTGLPSPLRTEVRANS
jgi:hypothetical protein